jgi:hypothetical protein
MSQSLTFRLVTEKNFYANNPDEVWMRSGLVDSETEFYFANRTLVRTCFSTGGLSHGEAALHQHLDGLGQSCLSAGGHSCLFADLVKIKVELPINYKYKWSSSSSG